MSPPLRPAVPSHAPGPALPPRSPVVTIFAQPGCHLCEDALAVLHRVREREPFVLLECDIRLDDTWFRDYLERIPVALLDGEELFEFFVDEEVLRAALARSRASRDVAPGRTRACRDVVSEKGRWATENRHD